MEPPLGIRPPPKAMCVAVGSAVPTGVLTNADLERLVDTSDEWIISRTGIRERRILAPGETLGSLALACSTQALARAGCEADAIDGIIVATTTADQAMPSMANVLQQRLGASRAWGFDLVNSCNGFVAALATACAFIESGRARRILLVAGDAMSPYMDYTDRNTCILFGDGCGAVVIEAGASDGPGVIGFTMASDGSGADLLCIPSSGSALRPTPEVLARGDHFLKQDGRLVYSHAVRRLCEVSEQMLAELGLDIGAVDLLVPHQANLRIMDAVAKRLQLPKERMVVNIERYGNTTAGTIPLALADALADGRLQSGSRLLIAAFGAGFAWGAAYLTWGRP